MSESDYFRVRVRVRLLLEIYSLQSQSQTTACRIASGKICKRCISARNAVELQLATMGQVSMMETITVKNVGEIGAQLLIGVDD